MVLIEEIEEPEATQTLEDITRKWFREKNGNDFIKLETNFSIWKIRFGKFWFYSIINTLNDPLF